MSKAPYMPLFVDAFLADTYHLTAEEIGCYMAILMNMWRRNGSVPNDQEEIAFTCRMRHKSVRWRKLWKKLEPFFTVEGERLIQKRLKKEWDYVRAQSEKQSQNAHARWNKNKDLDDATASAKQMPNPCPHTDTHIDSSKDESNTSTPLSILQTVLDDDHAKAVIEHRKAVKPKLTVRAAKLLAANLSRCPDPNKAADTMILRGWKSVEPEWLQRGGHSPPGQHLSRTQQASLEILEEIRNRESGTSRRGICGPDSEPSHGELCTATPRPKNLPAPDDNSLRGRPQIDLEADG